MQKQKYLSIIMTVLLIVTSCGAKSSPVDSQNATAPAPLAPTAATYYVATDGNDDNNTGSEASPWLTIQHAVEQLQPGDTVLVKSGTYAGARLENSGTAAGYLTLKAAPGATVVINGPGPQNSHQSALEIENWDTPVAYWVIEGLEVTGAPHWGIDIRGGEDTHAQHIVIRGNHVHDNGQSATCTGIFAAFTDDVLIENNNTHNNSEHGIYVNNSSDRFIIRNNVSHHNANCGIHLNGDESMGGDGVMSDGQVMGNTIYENGAGGGSGINMDGVSQSVVANNVLYNNHASGIAVFQGDGAICSSSNRIVHNTILMPDDGRWALTMSDGCADNVVLNNIFYSDHSYRGSIAAQGAVNLTSDYNIVVNRFTTDDGDSILTLAQWQALGYDAHSFLATPDALFVNAAAHDYRLRENSPALNVGSTQAGVAVDFSGAARPSGAGYDIGAYELQAGTAFTPTDFLYLPLVAKTTGALQAMNIEAGR